MTTSRLERRKVSPVSSFDQFGAEILTRAVAPDENLNLRCFDFSSDSWFDKSSVANKALYFVIVGSKQSMVLAEALRGSVSFLVALQAPDDDQQHFSPLKNSLHQAKFYVWDKCCYPSLCLQMRTAFAKIMYKIYLTAPKPAG